MSGLPGPRLHHQWQMGEGMSNGDPATLPKETIAIHGATRWVFLTRRWAIKLPSARSWRSFVAGMLANDQECTFSAAYSYRLSGLCPVRFRLPLGLLVVMPRARPLTDSEWDRFDYLGFINRDFWQIPAENKRDSFGWLDDLLLVAVDYG